MATPGGRKGRPYTDGSSSRRLKRQCAFRREEAVVDLRGLDLQILKTRDGSRVARDEVADLHLRDDGPARRFLKLLEEDVLRSLAGRKREEEPAGDALLVVEPEHDAGIGRGLRLRRQ